ncbi:hypothetical protein [Streptomyces umbrinus]|uniref:hypothetical protein n=1 Tax=Streptomyces umbrinus TaxID=67370 RepID=UPI003401FDEF
MHDSRDNGATDVWELDLTGCPVRPHESRMCVWLVDTDAAADSLEYDSQPPYERTYWISRRLGSRLPNPTYIPSASGWQSPPPSSPSQLP